MRDHLRRDERLELDLPKMAGALKMLEGVHDFTSYSHNSSCDSMVRKIYSAKLRETGSGFIIDLKADSFLRQMVRLIVSNTLRIGKGEKEVDWLYELLEKKDRIYADEAADPRAVWLMKVGYNLEDWLV
jgi:tRNA pseudouridine38-40 synthase